jgi:hypothetical protein
MVVLNRTGCLYFANRVNWTNGFTCAAVDANVFIDPVNVALVNAVYRAFSLASATSNTTVINSSWHYVFLHTCSISLFYRKA